MKIKNTACVFAFSAFSFSGAMVFQHKYVFMFVIILM